MTEFQPTPKLTQFQNHFKQTLFLLDQLGVEYLPKSFASYTLKEDLQDADLERFNEANRTLEEFHRLQWEGRNNIAFGPVTSKAAEIVWSCSGNDLEMDKRFPEGNYRMRWLPKFLTGVITGSNPKDIATWRFDITPPSPKFNYNDVIVQYDTSWDNWNHFRNDLDRPTQNYPLEILTKPYSNLQGKPWQLRSIEDKTLEKMELFLQRGKIIEFRSLADAVSAAILGKSATMAHEYEELLKKYNGREDHSSFQQSGTTN